MNKLLNIEGRDSELKNLHSTNQKQNQTVQMVQRDIEMTQSSTKWYQHRNAKIAGAVIILTLLLILIFNLIPSQGERLAQQFFEPFPATDFVEGKPKDAKVNQAIMAYQAGNYQEAIEKFEISRDRTDEFPVLFFKANAYLAEDAPLFAIGILEQLNATGATQNDPHIQWYLGLAYLQRGQLKKAQLTLQKVAAQPSIEGFKKIEAQQILDSLK